MTKSRDEAITELCLMYGEDVKFFNVEAIVDELYYNWGTYDPYEIEFMDYLKTAASHCDLDESATNDDHV